MRFIIINAMATGITFGILARLVQHFNFIKASDLRYVCPALIGLSMVLFFGILIGAVIKHFKPGKKWNWLIRAARLLFALLVIGEIVMSIWIIIIVITFSYTKPWPGIFISFIALLIYLGIIHSLRK